MFEVGDTVDRYEIEGVLGRGGMGSVFRAHDTRLRRPVALKVVDGRVTEEARAMLLREARLAATLMHPNIVTIFDVGEAASVPFMAMELVDGSPLRRHIGRPAPVTQAIRWILDVARALDHAHRAGLIHRDIKPGNVMITAAGAKVLDFGVARPLLVDRFTAQMPAMQTQPGYSVGTPAYMAPELFRGAPADPQTDQFAWGLVAHELLSGQSARPPEFNPYGPWSVPPLTLPPAVAAVIARALDPSPDRRFPTMGDAARELEPLAGPREATMELRAIPTASIRAVDPATLTSARLPSKRPKAFADPAPAVVAPLVQAALADIQQEVGEAFRAATTILTVDVDGAKARFFVQHVVLGADGRLTVAPSSKEAIVVAGNLIAADARAGNGRWRQIVIHLRPTGLDPNADIEMT